MEKIKLKKNTKKYVSSYLIKLNELYIKKKSFYLRVKHYTIQYIYSIIYILSHSLETTIDSYTHTHTQKQFGLYVNSVPKWKKKHCQRFIGFNLIPRIQIATGMNLTHLCNYVFLKICSINQLRNGFVDLFSRFVCVENMFRILHSNHFRPLDSTFSLSISIQNLWLYLLFLSCQFLLICCSNPEWDDIQSNN